MRPKQSRSRDPARPFAQVWALVRKIPRGKVATYGQLSQALDGRLSAAGVGWAMRAAPGDSLPWYRVVNSRGGVSTEPHAPNLQRALLEAEGVVFDEEGRIDLDRFQWKRRSRRQL